VLLGVLSSIMIAGIAAPAGAQTSLTSDRLFSGVTFKTDAVKLKAISAPVRRATAPAPAPRQGSTMVVTPMVLGGLALSGDVGIAVGGGVQLSPFMDREEFALQIDGLFSNVGGCDFCGDDDFSAKTISIAGAFLYKFKEMTNGWQPFAGGGIVFSRFSYSSDIADDFCQIFGVDCSPSATSVGIQLQGGIAKGKLQLEGRFGGTIGNPFIVLVGYKFGSK
jgi:hypothetical protein